MSLVALQFWSDQCSERAVGLGFAAGGLARQPVSVEWLWYRLILLIQGPCFPFKMIKMVPFSIPAVILISYYLCLVWFMCILQKVLAIIFVPAVTV